MSRSLRRPVLLLAAAGGLLTCGEGPSGATRRVTTVLTSRDSVYLEVGDSVVVRGGAGGWVWGGASRPAFLRRPPGGGRGGPPGGGPAPPRGRPPPPRRSSPRSS